MSWDNFFLIRSIGFAKYICVLIIMNYLQPRQGSPVTFQITIAKAADLQRDFKTVSHLNVIFNAFDYISIS